MEGIRLKRAVIGVGAAAAATLAPLAFLASGASATAGTATTTTVTGPASAATGQAATFTATVTPSTVSGAKPSGTVTFAITGSDASTVNCTGGSDAVTLKRDKARCKVPAGSLSASSSPYSVGATYSGDSTYAGSTATPVSVSVTPAKSKAHLKVDTKPASGTANTFTLTIAAGRASAQIQGSVVFAVSDTPSTSKAKRQCSGGNNQTVVVTAGVATATCSLSAGWFEVPAPSKKTPQPSASWNVSASFHSANADIQDSDASISGGSTH